MARAVVAAALGGRLVDGRRRRIAPPTTPPPSIAANHLVALIGQVERVAASAGLPLDAFADLMRAALDDAVELGPRRALTGPAARGDWDTVDRHRTALSALAGHRTELAAYDAMVGLARRLNSTGPGPTQPRRRSRDDAGCRGRSGCDRAVVNPDLAAAERVA